MLFVLQSEIVVRSEVRRAVKVVWCSTVEYEMNCCSKFKFHLVNFRDFINVK